MKCLNCGQEIDVHDIYCNYCGHINKGENQNNINEQNNNTPNNNNIINNNVNNNNIVNNNLNNNIDNNNIVNNNINNNIDNNNIVNNNLNNINSTSSANNNQNNININNQMTFNNYNEYDYNKKAFWITNGILYCFILFYSIYNYINITTPNVFLAALILETLAFLYFISMQKILIKAGFKWWYIFIPIYNIYLYFKITLGTTGIIFILIFAIATPLVASVMLSKSVAYIFLLLPLYELIMAIIELVSFYKLGKKFGTSGVLTMLFPQIMIPFIAFSNKCEYYD